MLGAVRLLADANFDRGEYGIMVRSDLKGAGIGWRLMEAMIEVAHWLGLNVIEGQVLRENSTMLSMCRHLGFDVRSEEHTSELQSLMRISYAVFCLKKKNKNNTAIN